MYKHPICARCKEKKIKTVLGNSLKTFINSVILMTVKTALRMPKIRFLKKTVSHDQYTGFYPD